MPSDPTAGEPSEPTSWRARKDNERAGEPGRTAGKPADQPASWPGDARLSPGNAARCSRSAAPSVAGGLSRARAERAERADFHFSVEVSSQESRRTNADLYFNVETNKRNDYIASYLVFRRFVFRRWADRRGGVPQRGAERRW